MKSKDQLTTLTTQRLIEYVENPHMPEVILGSLYAEALLYIRDILAEIRDNLNPLKGGQ